jgi:hypothetical protein
MNYKDFGFNLFDFGKLFLPIHKEDGDYKSKFPLLTKYVEFNAELPKGVGFDTLIKYIVLAFDINSPVRYTYNDMYEQRVKAAQIAGFEVNKNGKFPKAVEEMLLCENPDVNRMIIRYVAMMNNEDYATFVAFSEALRKQQEKILAGDVDQEKTKEMIANINTLKSSIKDLKEQLIGDSDDLQRTLYEFVESNVLGIFPEEVAKVYSFEQ